jgi:trans-aconitate 2-methyltransferase
VTPRDWDGATYDRISSPMEELARPVLDRLRLGGDETVLDAGCGSGRVTALLAERLPRGRVIGVDGSAAMIEAARARLGEGVDLRVADLAELDLGGARVDAIFSTATFHWIADHDRLFAHLRAALRDGGRLVAQCGGRGQVAAIRAAHAEVARLEPFAERFAGWPGPWTFAGPEETAQRLRGAGFVEARAWLESHDVAFDDQREWLRAIVLGTHLERLPEALRDAYLDAIQERLGPTPRFEYVRLNLEATAG